LDHHDHGWWVEVEMQYMFTYIKEDDYILANLSGAIDLFTTKNAIRDAGSIILEHQCNKILGDFRKTTFPLDVMEIIDLYQYWLKTLKANKLSAYAAKRVILLSPSQKTSEKFRFFETFSRNRSSRVKIFFDMDEAVEWLKEGKSKETFN
jgi:hypothetical protein